MVVKHITQRRSSTSQTQAKKAPRSSIKNGEKSKQKIMRFKKTSSMETEP